MGFYDQVGWGYADTQEVNKKLFNLIKALPEEIERAVREEAELILEVAKNPQLIPIKSGAMRDSGRVTETVTRGNEISTTIEFGGSSPSSRYTYWQHENMEINHPNGGGPKFLEKALQAAYPGQLQRMSARIKMERILG